MIPGAINVYVCSQHHETVTVDLVDGTTPMVIGCCADNCMENAFSKWYNVDQDRTPTHEWYRPLSLRHLTFVEAQHVRMGGLLLRKIKQ